MPRTDWDKLTPDEQYSIVIRLIERLEKYEQRDLPPTVVKPSSADEAAQMIQEAWDKRQHG